MPFKKFKERLNSSILTKLLIIIITANVVVYCGLIAFNQIKLKRLLEDNVEHSLALQSEQMANTIDDYFYNKSTIVKQLASNPAIKTYMESDISREEAKLNDDYQDVLSSLNSALEIDSDLGLTWFVSENSNFLVSSDGKISKPEYNLKERPWYGQASSITDKDAAWFSFPIVSSATGEPAIFIIKPVFDENDIIGYIGANIYLDTLPDIMGQFSVPDGQSSPLLVASDGTVIYSPDENLHLQYDLHLREDIVGTIATDMLNGGSSFDKMEINGEPTYVKYTNIPLTGWSLAIFIETTAVSGGLVHYGIMSILSLIIVGFFLIAILTFFIRRTFKDIPSILSAIEYISGGEYNIKIGSGSSNELGQIAGAIDGMTGELENKMRIIESYAHSDLLTGLPNRRVFISKLTSYTRDARIKGKKLAVCFIDLDDFKLVNDTLGHSFGDEVLMRFSDVLQSCVKNEDVVSRFGGDEFLVILSDIEGEEDVIAFFDKLTLMLKEPIKVLGKELFIRTSAGVSIFPTDSLSPDDLLRNCDMAMHLAKDLGKSRVEFYNSTIHDNIQKKSQVGQYLNNALDNNELYLNYQPIVSAKSGNIYGFEALIRWNNEELGIVPPDEFIAIAENTGTIISIGTWILEESCRIHKKFCDVYGDELVMSVNISPEQIKRPDFYDVVVSAVKNANIKPHMLQLEITENVLFNFTESANDILTKLVNYGVIIALDDFGTGYSSLSYLKNFPIRYLKIDKSFIDEIFNSKKDYAITGSIINLVHSLDIKTVAEGVETQGQYDYLNKLNIDLVQGYLLGKPLSERDAVKFLLGSRQEGK